MNNAFYFTGGLATRACITKICCDLFSARCIMVCFGYYIFLILRKILMLHVETQQKYSVWNVLSFYLHHLGFKYFRVKKSG